MPEKYYIKKSNKYIPVNDPYAHDGLSNGNWLVVVKKGSTSCRTLLNTKFVELDAALYYLEEELCNAISKASTMRPTSVKMSPKEIKAWNAYRKIMGEDIPRMFEYASNWEIAHTACQKIKEIIVENKFDEKKIKEKYEKKDVINAITSLEL